MQVLRSQNPRSGACGSGEFGITQQSPRREFLRELLRDARDSGDVAATDEQIEEATMLMIGLFLGKYMTGEPARVNWLTPGVKIVVDGLSLDPPVR